VILVKLENYNKFFFIFLVIGVLILSLFFGKKNSFPFLEKHLFTNENELIVSQKLSLGKDGIKHDALGNVTRGNEIRGYVTRENEIWGNITRGNDTLGNEIRGNVTRGNVTR
jgi:hypothetical protein